MIRSLDSPPPLSTLVQWAKVLKLECPEVTVSADEKEIENWIDMNVLAPYKTYKSEKRGSVEFMYIGFDTEAPMVGFQSLMILPTSTRECMTTVYHSSSDGKELLFPRRY